MQKGDQIAAVIDQQIRAAGECFAQVGFVIRIVDAVAGMYGNPVCYERRGNVILRGQGIASGDMYLGAAVPQDGCQICGFCLQMDGHGYFQSREGFTFQIIGANRVQNRHVRAHPVDFVPPAFGKCGILDIIFHWFPPIGYFLFPL